jgi:hypothetical protein
MFVVHNCTLTLGPGGFDTVVVPGVYSADQFQSITNITRNSILYITSPEHDGSITVTDDGVQTTVTVWPGIRGAAPTDDLQVICYNDAPGISPGPAANVAVTNFPVSQNVNGVVSVSNFPATQPVSGTVGVTGSVSVTNFPATQAVSGSVNVGNFPTSTEISNDSGNPIPVSGAVTVGNFPATQPVSGSVSVSNFPATQAVTGTFFQTTQPVSGSVSVSNFPATQPVSGSVTVSGTVDVGNFPPTQAVTGTFFQATQPVSGSVSVSNFPATQAVTGTFFQATQPVSGSVSVSNFPATQAVTGTFFQATQPVSGTVTANQGTSPWVVSGTTSSNVASFPTTSTDAFGRLRVSEPFTMFDSSYRYGDNQLWSTATATGGTAVYNAPQGLMDLNVTTASGSSVRRQTTKVFSYQPGKALRNGEPVLTPSGWKKIESLKVGDQVFDGQGLITEVIGVYPQGKRKIFRITFDDQSIIDADEDHLWVTICRTSSKKHKKGDKRVLTTKQMIEEAGNVPAVANRWRIPCSPVLKIDKKDVKMDPYTLGAILGDGGFSHSASVTFTTADEEILDYLVCDSITKRSGTRYGYGLLGLSQAVRYYKLNNKNSFNKFVPTEYKFNSEEVRLAVLRGLMDTDGWVEKDGCTYFASCCKELAEDVCFLARSLGGSAKITERDSCFYYNKEGVKIECSLSYRVKISIPVNPFRLTRKASKWHRKWRVSFDRYVYSVQEICEDEATCIRVLSDEHTFITRNHIVTHNSLLVMTTFVCAPSIANLDQKVGYYNTDNGFFLEQDGLTTYFVERSIVSGAVTNTRVAQADWNVDPMDGTGPSGITLDISKAQILWMDLEWLGVGTVKMGFVINGTFYICHEWDHANLITSTYITTASLPLSCEITNTGTTASASTFKQICATVISEGGYALVGLQQSVGTPVTTPKTLAVAGTFYPIVSIRLKTTRLDAIAILTAISLQGTGNNNVFRWEVRASGVTTGGSWISAGANSSIDYNLTGTAYTGGRILASGFTSSSNQGTPSINILKEALFAFQLEREIYTATPYELTIVVAGATGGTSCYASMDWEEVSR